MKNLILAAMVLVLNLSLSDAFAGVAIVQAPEQSSGICAGPTAAEAFECAVKKCVAGGAAKDDCLEMSFCRGGWTVDVLLQSPEGPHWHEYFCGWKDKATAIKAGKLACNRERKKDLSSCAPVQLIDPNGNITEIRVKPL